MARCFVSRRLPGRALERLTSQHDVVLNPKDSPVGREELLARVADTEGLLCMLSDRIDAALLDAAPRLRVVSNYAVGYDNIDLDATGRRGIPVGNTPGVLTEATADLAFALILAAARRIPEVAAEVRAGRWGAWSPTGWLGADVHGQTLAIIGAGRIGDAVAHRAEGFSMRVLRVGRNDDLHAALAQSDIVSLHVPLTDATRHLIDAAALAAMKPHAILVNTARGGVVDQAALREALVERRLGAAALDVTTPEPLPADDPLLQAPNLIVVPHVGSATHSTRARMGDLAVDNLLAGLAGGPLPHPVRHQGHGQ